MEIKFSCEHCKTSVSTPMGMAGKKGKCPRCGKVMLIPAQQQEDLLLDLDEFLKNDCYDLEDTLPPLQPPPFQPAKERPTAASPVSNLNDFYLDASGPMVQTGVESSSSLTDSDPSKFLRVVAKAWIVFGSLSILAALSFLPALWREIRILNLPPNRAMIGTAIYDEWWHEVDIIIDKIAIRLCISILFFTLSAWSFGFAKIVQHFSLRNDDDTHLRMPRIL